MNNVEFFEALSPRVGTLRKKLGNFEISGVCSISAPKTGHVCFTQSFFLETELPDNILVLVEPKEGAQLPENFIEVTNARLAFAVATELLSAPPLLEKLPHTAPSDVASPHAGCKISPLASVAANARIGENTIIEAFCTIYSDVEIGAGCYIKSGARLGGQGFGFERDSDGVPRRIWHSGGLRIGNNVEIGCNSIVCAGTVDASEIHDHVKIDDNVLVAHNCTIGSRTMIAGCADISGSVVIGQDVWIGPRATISSKIFIGDGASIIIGSVVARHVKPNETFAKIRS